MESTVTNRNGVGPAGQAARSEGAPGLGAPLSHDEVRQLLRRRLEQLAAGVLLSRAGIDRLARLGAVRRYAAGETVIHQGVHGDFMAVVASGQVAVLARAEDSENARVILLPGSTFGEAMLFDARPSGSTVRATADAELLILPRASYLSVASQRWARPTSRRRSSVPLLALLALALVVFGVGLVLYHAPDLLADLGGLRGQAAGPGPAQLSDALRIVEPQQGAVFSRSAPVPVRAVVTEPGFVEAELHVNGQRQEIQVNPAPGVAPWQVEWGWKPAAEGAHRLTIQARQAEEEWWTSTPLTVTVVPTGTLALASNRDGLAALYTMDTVGNGVRRLSTGLGQARQPAWRRDGALAFVAESEPGRMVLRTLQAGRDPVDLAPGLDPAWSPDGTRLAYTASVDNVSQVFIVPVSGGVPLQVTAEETYAGQPAWSPDGQAIAYVAERDNNWDIWIAGLDGSAPRRLTDDPAMDWAPAWSPEGSRLAFVSNRAGTHQLYTMRPDGADVRALTDFAQGAEAPAWSPDGYWLAFVAYSGQGEGVNARELYLMRADGRDPVRVTYNTFDDAQPDWGWLPQAR